MLCLVCLKERPERDFFVKDLCYKCQFKNKLKICSSGAKKCKICKNNIPNHRTTYCSSECCETGKKEKIKNYWVFNCKAEKVEWRYGAKPQL